MSGPISKSLIAIKTALWMTWSECGFRTQHEWQRTRPIKCVRCLNGSQVCQWIFLDGSAWRRVWEYSHQWRSAWPMVVMSGSKKAQLLCESRRVMTAVCLISFCSHTNDMITTSDTSGKVYLNVTFFGVLEVKRSKLFWYFNVVFSCCSRETHNMRNVLKRFAGFPHSCCSEPGPACGIGRTGKC